MKILDITAYDWIVVNSSAGKDSQAMLDYVVRIADAHGISRDKIVVAHADLGRCEWKGTKELAIEQADAYGLRFEVEKRPQGDLLEHVEQRGMWPSSTARYCTSDHKRGQVQKIFTRLAKESQKANPETFRKSARAKTGREVRILSCMGIRAQESPARAKKTAFETNKKATGSGLVKAVDNWLPIFDWSEDQVWKTINESGVKAHYAYKLGMPRLSCCFCIFAPKAALVVAGQHNPELLDEYVAVEKRIDHTFRQDLSMADVKAAIEAGEQVEAIQNWNM